MTLREVAAHVELSVPTVMSAHRAYEAGGWKAVDVKQRGRKHGQGRHLTPEQEVEIRKLISDKTPDQLKMGFVESPGRRATGEGAFGYRYPDPHGGRIPQALGLLAAEADQEGLRTAPCASTQMAG